MIALMPGKRAQRMVLAFIIELANPGSNEQV